MLEQRWHNGSKVTFMVAENMATSGINPGCNHPGSGNCIDYRRGQSVWYWIYRKTLWDWLQLLASLAIPVVVGFGAVWFTTRQGKVADVENKDNQRETALQAYIDKMSELLLEKHLRDSQPEDEVRKIAQVRSLTVVRTLDPIRKGSVLQFLYESGLIDRGTKNILELKGADLKGASLFKAQLHGVNLCRVDLSRADLRMAFLNGSDLKRVDLSDANLSWAFLNDTDLFKANLSHADLRETNLNGALLNQADLSHAELHRANLYGANLSGADLSGADLSGAIGTAPIQLAEAKSLKGATMPDVSIHP